MREIKFRAWYSGFMYYNVTRIDFDADGANKVQLNHSAEDWDTCGDTWSDRSEEDFMLMQYTGLKDKNGKEIYEGDIITWNCKGSVIHGRVYHGRDGWWISDARRGNTTRAGKASTISVIGNIFENPELLEK